MGETLLGLDVVVLRVQLLFLVFHILPALLLAQALLFLVRLDRLEGLPGEMERHLVLGKLKQSEDGVAGTAMATADLQMEEVTAL